MITKPFIKWAGGKTWLTKDIVNYLPQSFNDYYEPFLGAGSIFFSLQLKKKAFLSDVNPSLINTYLQLRENYTEVKIVLDSFINSEEEFYKIRSTPQKDDIYEAAKFIYLNKTCFNGIYRVNSRGIYNVPYGRNKNVNYYDSENMARVIEKLNNATIESCDFEESLNNVRAGDLVFLDPPYTVSHRNNGFIEYNQKLFLWEDQQRLAKKVQQLNEIGAYFILTNAVHSSISELYDGLGKFTELERNSNMSSNISKRGKIGEYIITNCI